MHFFGESPSRVVVSVRECNEGKFLDLLNTTNIPFALMGHVTRGDIRIDDQSFGDVAEYKEIYNNTLEEKLK